MTPEQAAAHLADTDPRFELTDADIDGVRYRVFRNAPAHLRELLEAAAPAYGERDVLVYQDERWSYPRLCDEVTRLAHALGQDLNVAAGDRVALAMRNYPELPILILAITAMGAVAVPMNAWWTEQELAYALEDCGARVVFADGPRYQQIRPGAARLGLDLVAVRDADGERRYADLLAARSETHWPDTAIATDNDFAVLYSSGSTGHPKGVRLTHRGAISAVYSWVMARLMAPLLLDEPPPAPANPPASLVVTPLFHVTALQSNFLQGLATGTTMSLMYKWDAEEAVRIIKRERVTRFVGVPTQSAELMDAARRMGEKLESLEAIGGGGAKRPAVQVGQLAEAFPGAAIASGWGMTETNALGITLAGPDYVSHPEAAGRPTPPLQEFRIVDGEGRPLPVGEVGELTVKSAANMRGYLNLPEATAQTLRAGWLLTGDLAYQDDNGLFYIVDRKKSIIIRGGENISCLEVEGVLHRHPDVVEAGVFPVPDPRLGETVGAGVQLKAGARVSEAQLIAFVAEHIARFKAPERIWMRADTLPRGGTDKIDRRALRDECLAAGHPGLPLPSTV
ncbi:long-chain fatty acid--CoA ligase [Alcanivorax sp. N3-2A]|nr:long-chain fatty acid--CoA ligase [Alcanivorax sp. N3-2A]|tara:strand:+ start:35905 stop:37605 length:1701 start_codon:yes stop_codon:yes gene_type:complete